MSRSMILLRRRLQSADHKLAPLTQMVCGLRYTRKIHVALTTICSAAFLLCILFIHNSCGIGYQDSFCYRQRQEKCYVANDSPRFIDFVSIAYGKNHCLNAVSFDFCHTTGGGTKS